MAAGNLGSLVLSLGLDGVEFFSGLTKAEYETRKTVQGITRSLESIKSAVTSVAGALGVGLSVAAITAWGKEVVAATEHLHNLSVETGSSVEDLSRLSNIAKISGTSFDTFQTAIDRLAAGMGGAEGKGTRVGEALKLLGVNATDPAQALQQVADKLAKFADGATKAALAKDLFGRGGVEFLNTLKAIAERTDIASTKTTEQAVAATQLAEKIRQLKTESQSLADALLNDVVPALTRVTTAISEASKIKGSLFGGLGLVAGISPFASVDENIKDTEKDIENLQAKIADVKSNSEGLWAKIAPSSQNTENLERGVVTLEQQLQVLRKLKAQSLGNLDFLDKDRRPFAPILPPKPTGGGVIDDPTRKILEAALAALKSNTEQEKAVLENRNQYLQAVFDRGESSIEDYYAQKQAAQAEDLRITSQNYLDELALIESFIKNAKTERDKAQGLKEQVAATARQQLASIQSAGKADQILNEQTRALKDYGRALDDVNATMLELQGNTAAAASIRFDAQREGFRQYLDSKIGSTSSTPEQVAAAKAAKEQIDSIGRITVAQARLNDVTARYSNIIGIVGIAQARIDLLAQTGAITEIDAINKKAELAQQYVGVLTAEADAAQRVAETYAIGSKQRADALLTVAQLRLQIDQLAASSDVLAKKFNDISSGAFSTFLTDLIDHTKSVKQAFTDMAKSIEQQISKIAAQNISESLFGKGGPLGGLGSGLASLFGAKGAAAATGADASVAALGASAVTADAGVAALGAAATTTAGIFTTIDLPATTLGASLAAAALAADAFALSASTAAGASAASSGGNFAAAIVAAVASGGSFAGGGDPPVGKPSWVGERGPELFIPKTAGTIIPANTSEQVARIVKGATATLADAPSINAVASIARQDIRLPGYDERRFGIELKVPMAQFSLEAANKQRDREVIHEFKKQQSIGLEWPLPKTTIPASVREKSTTFISKQLAHIFGYGLAQTTGPTETGITSILSKIFGTSGKSGAKALVVGERGPELFVPKTAGTISPANVSEQVARVLGVDKVSTNSFGGFFARGGEPPVGKLSIVGEKGPEWFLPKTAGTIIPATVLDKWHAPLDGVSEQLGRIFGSLVSKLFGGKESIPAAPRSITDQPSRILPSTFALRFTLPFLADAREDVSAHADLRRFGVDPKVEQQIHQMHAIVPQVVRDYQREVVHEFKKQELTDRTLYKQRLEMIKDIAHHERVVTKPSITTFISKQFAHIFGGAAAADVAHRVKLDEKGSDQFAKHYRVVPGKALDIAEKAAEVRRFEREFRQVDRTKELSPSNISIINVLGGDTFGGKSAAASLGIVGTRPSIGTTVSERLALGGLTGAAKMTLASSTGGSNVIVLAPTGTGPFIADAKKEWPFLPKIAMSALEKVAPLGSISKQFVERIFGSRTSVPSLAVNDPARSVGSWTEDGSRISPRSDIRLPAAVDLARFGAVPKAPEVVPEMARRDVIREFNEEFTNRTFHDQRREIVKDILRHEGLVVKSQPTINQLAHALGDAPVQFDSIKAGIGGFLSKLFGGASGAKAGVASVDHFIRSLDGAATATARVAIAVPSTAAVLPFVAAASPAASLSTSGILGFASGGDPPVGRPSLIGERGPELFMPKQAGTIIPLDEFRNGKGGNTVNIGDIHVNVPQGTSAPSAGQIGLKVGRELQRAAGNLG